MTTEELLEIRHNSYLRDNYLVKLTNRNKIQIFTYAKRTAGSLATIDIINNECTQYFMLGANRGINNARINDDGRGKNNSEGFICLSGIRNVRSFLVEEFRLDRKHRIEFNSITPIEYNISENIRYDNEIVGNLIIEEIIQKLKPIDRRILQLIIYGESDNQTMVPLVRDNRVSNNLVSTLANTLGYSENWIYNRICVLRGVFSTLPLH